MVCSLSYPTQACYVGRQASRSFFSGRFLFTFLPPLESFPLLPPDYSHYIVGLHSRFIHIYFLVVLLGGESLFLLLNNSQNNNTRVSRNPQDHKNFPISLYPLISHPSSPHPPVYYYYYYYTTLHFIFSPPPLSSPILSSQPTNQQIK